MMNSRHRSAGQGRHHGDTTSINMPPRGDGAPLPRSKQAVRTQRTRRMVMLLLLGILLILLLDFLSRLQGSSLAQQGSSLAQKIKDHGKNKEVSTSGADAAKTGGDGVAAASVGSATNDAKDGDAQDEVEEEAETPPPVTEAEGLEPTTTSVPTPSPWTRPPKRATYRPLPPGTPKPTKESERAKFVNPVEKHDPRTPFPEPDFETVFYQFDEGEYLPEEPERLPGLRVHRRRYTPEELMERHQRLMFVYSFVNGTEKNHFFRKRMSIECGKLLRQTEQDHYVTGTTTAPKARGAVKGSIADQLLCVPGYLRDTPIDTMGDVLSAVLAKSVDGADSRDRETDELRHSLRSIEQHIKWHRGQVVMVSPGHHPPWMDPAKNFLAGTCGGPEVAALREQGTHVRVTTVHQDAVMPYGIRLTIDSHSIEQHLWRVKNITPVHIYWNDDYFVNRDVSITHLFNEYGGTIVRTEKGILRHGIHAPENGGSWSAGVKNTQLFNILELDVYHEDHVPPALGEMWEERRRTRRTDNSATSVTVPSLDTVIDTAQRYPPEPFPAEKVVPRRYRRFATHAPFVYCTRMHEYLETRYERELAANSWKHRSRNSRDLYVPFMYNAFIMARPWTASRKVLPYLLDLNASRAANQEPTPIDIYLDNEDGCAPASLRGGFQASECAFEKFHDNLTRNVQVVERIRVENPLFFNINSGFSIKAAQEQLKKFLHEQFPTPIYLERETSTPVGAGDAALPELYRSLMELPVIVIASFEEGLCPLVRSLQLGLPDHTGRVVTVRHRFSDGDADPTLAQLRTEMNHRVLTAMPLVRCAFNTSLVASVDMPRESDLPEIINRALTEIGEEDAVDAVVLPASCERAAGHRVRAIVIDGHTPSLPITDALALRSALAMPGQTLALEDFRTVSFDGSDVALVLAREDANVRSVNWISGGAEKDLLMTFPIPLPPYDDLDAPAQWM